MVKEGFIQAGSMHGTSFHYHQGAKVWLFCFVVGDVGELSEIFQWKGEVPRGLPGWKEEEKQHLQEEISDILLYLVRLSDVCRVDLGKAAMRKMEHNAIKYPIKLFKGSSRKYTEINENGGATAAVDSSIPADGNS
ncbi:hypothetical protein SAY86_005369 [Trapa natans]|uniref:dCTP pyrophosphatase 1 n=1 Tax=Trapa natans TaxID=22666 RepID=A0AAN7L0L9_TRANT|nr:hypothetical protein SAY86_005369 [Trapa natans]